MRKNKLFKNIPLALMILGLTSTPLFADTTGQGAGISPAQTATHTEKTLDISDSLLELKKEQKQIDSKVDFNNNPFFKNTPLDEEAQKTQEAFIKNLKAKYFEPNVYGEQEQKDLNNLFVNFISLGMNKAADEIWNNKSVKLDLSRYSDNGLTPLMAASITPIEGGNVEYAIKLIDNGVDVNQGSKKTNISPASLASTVDNYKVVAYLILKGAKFMSQDALELRPIDYALRNNSVKSAAVIKESLDVVLDKKREDNKNNKSDTVESSKLEKAATN